MKHYKIILKDFVPGLRRDRKGVSVPVVLYCIVKRDRLLFQRVGQKDWLTAGIKAAGIQYRQHALRPGTSCPDYQCGSCCFCLGNACAEKHIP
jgi:hypothetical protein